MTFQFISFIETLLNITELPNNIKPSHDFTCLGSVKSWSNSKRQLNIEFTSMITQYINLSMSDESFITYPQL